MSLPPKVWREDFKIHSYEIGASGFVSPQAICRFMQEVASNHASALGVAAETIGEREQMWVISQLSLRMQHYPRWHESMNIETWPVQKDSMVRGYRDFAMTDAGQRKIGEASTAWLLLNKSSKRPLKLPQWLADVAASPRPDDFMNPPREDEFSGTPDSVNEFKIRASDIDWNMHVNNVCYLEWALEGVPAEFRLESQVSGLDIAFLAEGKYGSAVIAQTYKLQGPNGLAGAVSDGDGVRAGDGVGVREAAYLHRILNKDSQKTLGLLRTAWEPRRS